MKRGAIDFDFKEAKVLVDEDGKPTDVVLRERSVAEKLIEEFMLAANETVAEHFHWMEVPFIYRIHEDPKEDKLSSVSLSLLRTLVTSLKEQRMKFIHAPCRKLLKKFKESQKKWLFQRLCFVRCNKQNMIRKA